MHVLSLAAVLACGGLAPCAGALSPVRLPPDTPPPSGFSMHATYDQAFGLVLKHEGGYVDHPDDPGGRPTSA